MTTIIINFLVNSLIIFLCAGILAYTLIILKDRPPSWMPGRESFQKLTAHRTFPAYVGVGVLALSLILSLSVDVFTTIWFVAIMITFQKILSRYWDGPPLGIDEK